MEQSKQKLSLEADNLPKFNPDDGPVVSRRRREHHGLYDGLNERGRIDDSVKRDLGEVAGRATLAASPSRGAISVPPRS